MHYEKGSPYAQLSNSQQGAYLCSVQKAYMRHNILPLCTKTFPHDQRIVVVEFGPGLGLLAELLHEQFPDLSYTAVDIDPQVLQRIQTRFPGSRVVKADSSKEVAQQLQANSFDVVVAIDVWEHLPPSDLEQYTAVATGLLNGRGVFIAQVPNWGCPFTSNTIFAGDLTHYNRFNELSARQLLLRAGVPDNWIRILPHAFPPLSLLWRVRSLLRAAFLTVYQLVLLILGLYRVNVATPNLIMVVNCCHEISTTTLDSEQASEIGTGLAGGQIQTLSG